MKKLLYFIIFIFPAIFSMSCGTHYCGCTTPKPFVTTALKNDTNWTSSAFKGLGDSYPNTIAVASINNANVKDTIIITFNYNTNQSVYKLDASQVYYHSAVNGVVKSYQLDPTYDANMLTVTDYEVHWNFVQGTFSLKFLNPGQPDISFLGGNFEVIINK